MQFVVVGFMFYIYLKYGPVFLSINAGHRTSRKNRDPSVHKGSVSCSNILTK